MSTPLCVICKAQPKAERGWSEACPRCTPVWRTCCTSADEAVRHDIPKLDADAASRCLTWERGHDRRITVILALERRLRKLAKANPKTVAAARYVAANNAGQSTDGGAA